jgi:hypothetical protein
MKHAVTIAAILALFSLISFYFIYKKGWEEKVSDSLNIPMIKLSLHFSWALWISAALLIALIAINIGMHLSNRKDGALAVYNPNENTISEPKEEL